MKPFLKKNWPCFAIIAICALICMLMHMFVFHTVRIEGRSMVDTLRSGDIILVSQMDYRFKAPERGDIVECSFPGRSGTYIKRVIGLPGETISIRDSRTYINDIPLSEPYAIGPSDDYSITLAENQYLMLGDNRSESYDSRAQDMGPIGRENIIGRVCMVLWPFQSIK